MNVNKPLTIRTQRTKIHCMRDIEETHKKLLEAQEAHPPIMTIREMGGALGSDSPSYVKFLLDKLVDLGLAERVMRGKKHVYRIVNKGYRHNEAKHE